MQGAEEDGEKYRGRREGRGEEREHKRGGGVLQKI